MTRLWLDLETFSEQELKPVGVYVYAKHPSTRITLLAYAIDEGPVHVWDVTTGTPMPADLQVAIDDPEVIVCAHNSQFDRVVLRDAAGIDIPIERWVDSMVRAMSHALPGALADLGKAMGLPENQQKMREGHALMLKFCKPAPVNHKVRIYNRENSPEKWAKFIEYARQDVAAMRRLWHMMPNLNYPNGGLAEWHEDQHINDHGFAVDVELTKAGAAATDVERVLMTNQLLELTHGTVKKPTDRNGLLSFLNGVYKLGLPDLTKDTLSRELLKDDIPKTAREVIELRLAGNKTSTAKYAALDRATGYDGRFRGGLQFAGAGRTRRYAGRIFQPQNLPSRGLPPASLVDAYIAALKAGVHDLIFDDLTLYGAAALRGCVIAPPGKKLVQADLSNIEGRMLAWVAGEDWKLQAFREYDNGTGPDLYNITATSIIGGDPWKVPKKNRNVFGKVPDLASGYRGGVPGYQTFAHAYRVRMADHWDTIQSCINPAHVAKAKDNLREPWAKAQITTLEISDTEWLASETCKLAWRARHPATVDFWGYIQHACFEAMENPGVVFVAGKHVAVKKVTVQNQSWLLIKLPSNRYLTYYDPKIVEGNYGPTLSYMGMASDEGSTSRAWIRCYTHGGKLTGNICQTLARDVLVPAIARGAAAGYDTILSVHDELVCEADDIPERNHEELSAIMAQVPAWADGLPLAAAGFTAYRYKKED